jgi:hypothetical protein
MRRYRQAASRLRFFLAATVLLLVAIIAGAIIYDISRSDNTRPLNSKAQIKSITGSLRTFYSPYFRFQDTGKWVQNVKESSVNKYIYYKYNGLQIVAQLVVYVNQVPISLYLATSRVLPVRIVNSNSFDVTSISGPCGLTYGAKELHKVKNIIINGAAMLCDPDTPQYTVVLSEIGGNYQLKMHRLSGAPVQLVITYRDYNAQLETRPQTKTLGQIAGSFQSL